MKSTIDLMKKIVAILAESLPDNPADPMIPLTDEQIKRLKQLGEHKPC